MRDTRTKNPVPCKVCIVGRGRPKDQLCNSCAVRVYMPKQKYRFNDAMDAKVRLAWTEPKNLTESINALAREFSFPRNAIIRRARNLGLRSCPNKPWTEIERNYLRDHAGEMKVAEIAKAIHRSPWSVTQQLSIMGISGRVREGYSAHDLAQVFGCSKERAGEWIERGWLKRNSAGRVSEQSVKHFVKKHQDHYTLARVDEAWFKSIIFGAIYA